MVLTIVSNQRPETSCGHFARMNLRLISLAALSLTRGISSGSVYGQVNARNYSRWFKAVIFHVRMFLVKCCFYIQPELDIYFLMKSYVTFKQTVFELRLRWIDAHFKYCLLTKLGPFVLSLEFLKCLHLDKNVTPWKKESKIFYLSSITQTHANWVRKIYYCSILASCKKFDLIRVTSHLLTSACQVHWLITPPLNITIFLSS